jgi:hypothetical protein
MMTPATKSQVFETDSGLYDVYVVGYPVVFHDIECECADDAISAVKAMWAEIYGDTSPQMIAVDSSKGQAHA